MVCGPVDDLVDCEVWALVFCEECQEGRGRGCDDRFCNRSVDEGGEFSMRAGMTNE